MATYQELFDLQRNQVLLDKVTVAVFVAADTILSGSDTVDPPWDAANHANRVIWAKEAIKKPRAMAEVMMAFVLAANSGAAAGAISGAADSAIQTNINAVVDELADGTAVLG